MKARPYSRNILSDVDIMEYLADGATTGDIAKEYGYSPQTITDRVRIIKGRYGARTNEQMLVMAIKSGELNIGIGGGGPSIFGIPVHLDPTVPKGIIEIRNGNAVVGSMRVE